MPSIVIMAGGTGGHVFPGLAVATELKHRDWQVQWFGTADKMEAQVVPKHGFVIHFLNIAGLRGKGLVVKLITPFTLLKAVFAARKLLKNIQPDVVLGMGGYASGPGGIAAYTLGIPIVLHEQNAVFGLTNRYLAKIAALVLSGFDTSVNPKLSKAPSTAVFVGNPIRSGFADIAPLKHQPDRNLRVLIVGGSLGALALNEMVPPVLVDLQKNHVVDVWHQTGKDKSEPVKKAYQTLNQHDCELTITEFIDDVEQAYAWADVVICRAGALTVAEVAAAGRVAIFVPLPIAVDDHQTLNAENLAKRDAAIILQQSVLAKELPLVLAKVFADPSYRQDIANKARLLSQTHATVQVADYCESLIGKHTINNTEVEDELK
ncbi:undecaprenyldiphospho-muramoylpentapeptide beta-N-acetylglucosaminyltransferase [Glaciecola sp. SC05]|uniref:undecaprenyldiphospho-muramoylpentapeptide beta-N-acetylglucosaminyltransferase n=1 Tax=Glaciecola sp. SC05 TaxID=1987355 RepID=UPI0035278993